MKIVPFALPASLIADGYALRPETDADIPFLLRLYASTRERELEQMARWTIAQKSVFVAQQFDAQRRDYRTRIALCDFQLITRRGEPIGRFYLDTRATQFHVVDIALRPAWRGKGFGSAILAALIDAGHRCGRNIGLSVDRYNDRALGLYRRLGFVATGETAFHIKMEWFVSATTDDEPADADVA